MAGSGTIYTNVGSHWRLSVSWSATQNVSNNSSTVTAKTYWEALNGYGAINATTTRSGKITIDGTDYSFSATPSLSANQKKLLATKSKTVKHSGDGSGSVRISGEFSPYVNLQGRDYNRITISAKTFSLPTIPRASSMSSSASLTAGSNRTVTISRASSTFSHIVYLDIKNRSGSWVNITRVDFSTSQTSKSTSFTSSEFENIFKQLDGRTSADVRWNVNTYSGSTKVGTKTYNGTCTIPSLTSVSSTNGQGGSATKVYVDQTFTIGLNRSNSSFTHTVEISTGNYRKTITGVGTSTSWTPSSSEQSSIYAQLGQSSSNSANIRVTTYYGNTQVGIPTNKGFTYVANPSTNKPIFTATGIAHKDVNATTVAITANDQLVVQNRSNLQVTIPSSAGATAQNSAVMKTYSVTVNGVTKTANYSTSDVVISFGTVTASSNTNITIKATDSRGFSTSVTKTVTVIPYASPNIAVSVTRNNGFEAATNLAKTVVLKPLTVGSTNKNSLKSLRFRFKLATASTWGAWQNLTRSGGPTTYTVAQTITLSELQSWSLQIEAVDQLSTITKDYVISAGRPMQFFDPDLKAVGFFDFPTKEYSIKINGTVEFGANIWSGGTEGTGAMFLNNSDMTGLNGLYFNDISNNNGEGLMWLKTGAPDRSTNTADYDQHRVLDGTGFLNNNVIFSDLQGLEELWSGYIFMNGSEAVTPKRKISDCPNGWIMVWSRYDRGETYNSFWNFVYVPKRFGTLSAGGMVHSLGADPTIGTGSVTKIQPVFKYIYVNDTTITGHAQNGESPNNTSVLRYVYTW
ncbi:minor structural protein 2 [Bacillus phage SDFMU_Pbc]|uniref:Minor structural protein 2 n=1 Tax=Bacillus phage SDFMU_Pbc TaxID=3076135 RepID=A0AA96KRK2_9CAUD|nr:minor structural protein 2 [Bacillus phage SDFMU_Pbc]